MWHRRVRIIREYGIFQGVRRRESPNFFAISNYSYRQGHAWQVP
jgi:hypothetical protein